MNWIWMKKNDSENKVRKNNWILEMNVRRGSIFDWFLLDLTGGGTRLGKWMERIGNKQYKVACMACNNKSV